MVRVAKIYHPPSGSERRGKHVPSMLILGPLGPLQKELIPALFRIAGDHEIRHVDITHSPDVLDPERLRRYSLIFVAFEAYRDNEPLFRLLPDSIRSRITVLARPSDFPSVSGELRCACFCSGLKALLPREEAQILDHRHVPDETQ
ncbi:MAG: hypothetical protein HPY67_11600 [Syntrophaceae bacterium]|nr:hypothetical protein [Syntrophaceae bacterium]